MHLSDVDFSEILLAEVTITKDDKGNLMIVAYMGSMVDEPVSIGSYIGHDFEEKLELLDDLFSDHLWKWEH